MGRTNYLLLLDNKKAFFSGNDDTPGSDSNFETCLISNADLAALTSTPPSASDGIKMEPLKDHHHHQVIGNRAVKLKGLPSGDTK